MTVALLSLIFVGFQAPAKPMSVGDLMKSAAKYDRKVVTVVGKVAKYQERVAKKSKRAYTVFDLTDGKATVHVYMQNKPGTKIKDGDKAKVTGPFQREKKVGTQTYKDEIDASVVKGKTNGVVPSK
ncbi:MAG: hypothetical protein JSS66_03630 [Armatimonadetes bacterium]|nr:hypothetical protein [Armatimonadota bacterium]